MTFEPSSVRHRIFLLCNFVLVKFVHNTECLFANEQQLCKGKEYKQQPNDKIIIFYSFLWLSLDVSVFTSLWLGSQLIYFYWDPFIYKFYFIFHIVCGA